jgi:hypothetical protein
MWICGIHCPGQGSSELLRTCSIVDVMYSGGREGKRAGAGAGVYREEVCGWIGLEVSRRSGTGLERAEGAVVGRTKPR